MRPGIETGSTPDMAISSLWMRRAPLEETFAVQAKDGRIQGTMIHNYMHGDTLIDAGERNRVSELLRKYGLVVNDVHGSHGKDQYAWSPHGESRKSGIAIVKSGIDAAAEWAAVTGVNNTVLTLHAPTYPENRKQHGSFMRGVYAAMDEIIPYAEHKGVTIGLENFFSNYSGTQAGPSNLPVIQQVLDRYKSATVGFTYDPGHHNLSGDALPVVEKTAVRLVALHLNNNPGTVEGPSKDDQHKLLDEGTVDIEGAALIVGNSSYTGPVSMEVGMRNHPGVSPKEFLDRSYTSGMEFAEKVAKLRGKPAGVIFSAK